MEKPVLPQLRSEDGGNRMTEYIEREAAIETLVEYFNSMQDFVGYNTPKKNAVGECIERIKNDIPAADVAPARKGLWIWDDEGYHCSECFYHAYGETGEVLSGNYHYCPNCGAKML